VLAFFIKEIPLRGADDAVADASSEKDEGATGNEKAPPSSLVSALE